MLHTIRDFFVIGHVLGLSMNEWVEVVAAETEWASDGHVRILINIGGDEEREKPYVYIISMLESYMFESDLRQCEIFCNFSSFSSHIIQSIDLEGFAKQIIPPSIIMGIRVPSSGRNNAVDGK